MATTKKTKAPWKRPAPPDRRRTHLTAASRRKARASAKRAGRRYPSLVDNMNATRRQKKAAADAASRKRKPSAGRKRAAATTPRKLKKATGGTSKRS